MQSGDVARLHRVRRRGLSQSILASWPTLLNFQNRNGKIKPYQARQLIAMIDKYENEL